MEKIAGKASFLPAYGLSFGIDPSALILKTLPVGFPGFC
jgi:hypothetical protein